MYLESNLQSDGEPTPKVTCFCLLLITAMHLSISEIFTIFFLNKTNTHVCMSPLVSCVFCCEQVPKL